MVSRRWPTVVGFLWKLDFHGIPWKLWNSMKLYKSFGFIEITKIGKRDLAEKGGPTRPPSGPIFIINTCVDLASVCDWRCRFLDISGFRRSPGGPQGGPHSGPPGHPPGTPKVKKSQNRENGEFSQNDGILMNFMIFCEFSSKSWIL